MGFSFIHIADIHLGRPFSDLSKLSYDEKIKQIFDGAVEKAFNNFIDFTLDKHVDFVLISGDTFDNCEQDFKSKLILKEGLKKLDRAGIKVFLACGNHDPVFSYNKNTFDFDENSNIKIIGLNAPIAANFIVNDKNNNPIASINAFSFSENHLTQSPLKSFGERCDLFNIGLLHCDLNADKSSPYGPCTTYELQGFNYDYWALGHIHIPMTIDDSIQYSGTIQGRNTKETGVHGLKYVEVENNKIVKKSFIPLDVVRYENLDIDLTSAIDTTSAYNIIYENISEFINSASACRLFILKLKLNGSIEFYSDINDDFYSIAADRIKNDFTGKVYISEFINKTSFKIDEKTLFEDDGISGEIYRAATDENIQTVIENLKEDSEFKKLLKECCFTDEDYSELKEEIAKKCLNLAGNIYLSESKED